MMRGRFALFAAGVAVAGVLAYTGPSPSTEIDPSEQAANVETERSPQAEVPEPVVETAPQPAPPVEALPDSRISELEKKLEEAQAANLRLTAEKKRLQRGNSELRYELDIQDLANNTFVREIAISPFEIDLEKGKEVYRVINVVTLGGKIAQIAVNEGYSDQYAALGAMLGLDRDTAIAERVDPGDLADRIIKLTSDKPNASLRERTSYALRFLHDHIKIDDSITAVDPLHTVIFKGKGNQAALSDAAVTLLLKLGYKAGIARYTEQVGDTRVRRTLPVVGLHHYEVEGLLMMYGLDSIVLVPGPYADLQGQLYRPDTLHPGHRLYVVDIPGARFTGFPAQQSHSFAHVVMVKEEKAPAK